MKKLLKPKLTVIAHEISSNKNADRQPEEGLSYKYEDEVCELVNRMAYEKFEARGGQHGHDLEDWLAAEREVKIQIINSQRPQQLL